MKDNVYNFKTTDYFATNFVVALVCVEAYEECVAMFAYRFYRKRQAFFGEIDHGFSFPAGALPRLCF